MAENNRKLSNQSQQSNEDWDQNRNRFNREEENRMRENYGDVGYGTDYNQNQGMRGHYGSKGYSGDSARGKEMENQGGYGATGNIYGGAYSSDYGRQYGYNEGNFDDQYEPKRKAWQNTGGYGNQYGQQQNEWRQDTGYQGRQDWGRGRVNTGMETGYENKGYQNRDYESNYGSQYGAGQYREQRDRSRNMYGGDTRNYGNMNQGGYDRGWWDRTKDEVSSWFGDEDAERRRRRDEQMSGGYRGKGPKDYHRSEDRIREDVCDRLTDDDMLDATNIQVQVQGDEVILTGNVNSRDQKRRAEDLVESISGVKNVENKIRVGSSEDRSQL